jgi:hypothetical protein
MKADDHFANIGADGVLLYHRPGSPIPAALVSLRPFADWVCEVERAIGSEHHSSDRQAG